MSASCLRRLISIALALAAGCYATVDQTDGGVPDAQRVDARTADAAPALVDAPRPPTECDGQPAGARCEVDGECDGSGHCIHILAESELPEDIAVDERYVYWTNGRPPAESQVQRCAIDGCARAPELIANGQIWATRLDLRDRELVWTNWNVDGRGGGEVLSCPTEGPCTPRSLLTGPLAQDLVLGSDTMFLGGMDVLRSCARTGCATASAIARHDGLYSWHVALTGTTLVWVTDQGVFACETTSCSPRRIVEVYRPNGLATDGAFVYWTEWEAGAVRRCAISGCAAPQTLAVGLVGAMPVVTDGRDVYFATLPMGDGEVYTVPADGSAPARVVATGPRVFSAGSLALDARNVYWTDFNSNVVARAAR